jgi:hypothetical protein
MPRAPVPFFGCGGTPHGRGSFAERTVSGGRLSGRGKGVAKQAGVARGGPLFTICTKRGVGTWWRRNLSGTVSVTWRSVPGGCRREGWKESGRGSLTAERNGPGRREKAGRPGFPRNGKERARKKRRKRDGRGSLAMGRNGPGRKGESGMAGVSSQREGTGQGEKGERGMARVPSQWEGTGQEEKEKAGWRGFPRNGKDRARKKKEKAGWPGFPRNGKERDVSKVVSGVAVGGWFGSGTGSGIGVGIGMRSAGSARSFYCLGRATVGLRAVGDSRLGRWGSSAQRGVRVLPAGRNTGSGADSVDAVKAVSSALIFCPGSEKERNFSATGSVS